MEEQKTESSQPIKAKIDSLDKEIVESGLRIKNEQQKIADFERLRQELNLKLKTLAEQKIDQQRV